MRSRGCWLSPTLLAMALAAFVGAGSTAAAVDKESGGSDLMLVLDASGSMWGQVQNEHKIVIARRVLADLIGKVPAGVNIGLVAYGHRREADCDDIETVVPLGPTDVAALIKKINSLNARGKTPITKTLTQVFTELLKHERPATVVFVSDGIETCGGDPCQAVRDAKAKDIKFVMHVIGFDVGDVDVSQLECSAQAGGGLYFSAADAGQFANALGQAVAIKPETPLGKLSVKTTANGKLADVLLKVTRAGSGEEIANVRTYESPDSNPRIIPLEKGTYDLRATAVHIEGKPEQNVPDIVIEDGAMVEKTLDFSTGTLRIKATRNAQLADVTVKVLRTGTKEELAGGRTYESAETNPLVLQLPPGNYDVTVAPVGVKDAPLTEWKDVAIASGEVVDKLAELSSGKLRVKVTRNGALSDATIKIYGTGTKEQVAGGRTYVNPASNPSETVLAAGTYDVEVASVEIENKPATRWEAIVIAGNETVVHEHEFVSGMLQLGAEQGGRLVDATVQVVDPDTKQSIGRGRTYTNPKSNPKSFILSPGRYLIVVTPVKSDVGAKREIAVDIQVNGKVEQVIDFAK